MIFDTVIHKLYRLRQACALSIIISILICTHPAYAESNRATSENFIFRPAFFAESINIPNFAHGVNGSSDNSRQGRDGGVTVSESFYTTLKNSLASLNDNSKIFLAGLGIILAFILAILTLAFLV